MTCNNLKCYLILSSVLYIHLEWLCVGRVKASAAVCLTTFSLCHLSFVHHHSSEWAHSQFSIHFLCTRNVSLGFVINSVLQAADCHLTVMKINNTSTNFRRWHFFIFLSQTRAKILVCLGSLVWFLLAVY